MARFLITGAAGFIGSHLAESLAYQADASVICIDNLSTGSVHNLDSVMDRIHFVRGDITDLSFLHDVMTGVDYVFHQAALPSVPRSIADPIQSNHHNVNGTLNVLVAARDASVRRLVFASSSSVYGTDADLPKTEQTPVVPKSPYALTKLAGEHYCRIFYQVYGLETVCLRYFNVFGSRQNPDSQYAAVIPRFITRLLNREQPEIFGNGEQSRDFTFISNVVSANLKACYAPNAPGRVLNIGYGQQTTVNKVFSMIGNILNTDIKPVYSAERPGDVRHSHASISAAHDVLEYQPDISVEEGLKKTVPYYVKMLHESR